jgi:hypothetical protein
VDASDGPLGTITDFIIDDEQWEILDLVVNADDRKAVIPVQWVSAVSWDGRQVQLKRPFGKSVTAEFLSA